MNELRKPGYTQDFDLRQNCLACRNGQFRGCANELRVDAYYRFEGPADLAHELILYAISSGSYG